MTTTDDLGKESSLITHELSNQLSQEPHVATRVYIRLMFRRIGEIDTLNEKYQAQASIEARWVVAFDKLLSNLSSDDQKRLADGKSITLHKYFELYWNPHLYIENALGDLKEQVRYSAKKSKRDDQIYICEHRDIKGVFWEKLELQYFPFDVQDLSISIASMLHDDKVILCADPYLLSGVNLGTFVDQQEWSLYKHVDIEVKYATEFLLEGTSAEDNGDEEGDGDNNDDRKCPILTVTCHAARHSHYFYWNGFCLIFLINMVGFCIFAIPTNVAATRIQISCILLLTSITFRWVVNRSLPTISYLTSMDIYAIVCIFALVIQCLWHGIIGAITFIKTPDYRVTADMWFVRVDQYVFFSLIGIFVIFHTFIIIWLYMVPYKHRRNMAEKDKNYELIISKRKKTKSKSAAKKALGGSSGFSRIPIEKTAHY